MYNFLKKALLFIFWIWLPCPVRMTWIPDDSSCEFTVNGSLIISHNNDSRDDIPFNCMWMEGDGESFGKHYWKISFETLRGKGGIGITSTDCFKKGYGRIGLQYGGKLSDGLGLLVDSFGPTLSAGDAVGMLVSFEGDRLKVYLDINGKSLGLAFNVPAIIFTPVSPMVYFYESGSATCEKKSEIPNITERLATVFSGIEGNWKLENITDNEIYSPIQLPHILEIPTMRLTKISDESDDEYRWSIWVANTFMAILSKKDVKWKTSSIARTVMGSTSAVIVEFQRKILSLMKTVETLDLESDGSLFINSNSVLTVWKRYDNSPAAYISDVLSPKNSRCGIKYY